MAIAAPHRGETSHPADILHFHPIGSSVTLVPVCPNKKTSLSVDVAIEKTHEPNPIPEIQAAHGILRFLSMSIRGLKNQSDFRGFKVI
jgi:hypothetical protein